VEVKGSQKGRGPEKVDCKGRTAQDGPLTKVWGRGVKGADEEREKKDTKEKEGTGGEKSRPKELTENEGR